MQWHNAGTYRTGDGRGGGANGARIRLAPQKGNDIAGVLTHRVGTFTNDFFLNLLDMGTEWRSASPCGNAFTGVSRFELA